MLAACLALALSQLQPADVGGPIFRTNRVLFPQPSFVLFPANGAGVTGGECAGNIPTGALHGETVTFTRAGGQTCTRANGNVVKLTANQPVVESLTGMALSDGNSLTGGPQLGMLDEAAATNTTIQSEAFDNAAWAKAGSGVAAPTVTANAAFAPDGTLTAERIQIPATTGAQFSIIQQAAGCTLSVSNGGSFYIIGNGTSGTFSWNLQAPLVCGSCAYNSTTWSRCTMVASLGGTTAAITLGNDSSVPCASGAQDVFVWGGQCESNTQVSSYIPTTTVSVARSATSWSIDTTTLTPPVTTSGGCFGADAYFPKSEVDPNMAYGCGFSGNGAARVPYEARLGASDHELRTFDSTNQSTGPAIASITYAGTKQSVWGWWQTGVGINANGTAWGLGTPNATYNNLIGGGGYSLGHAASSCGNNAAAWLTRIRMDTDVTGAKCR